MADPSIEAWTQFGHFGGPGRDNDALVYHDTYPSLDAADDRSLGLVVDRLLADLPHGQRRAVELTVLAGMSYRDAARYLDLTAGGEPDGKRVWRQARRGLAAIRRRLETGWPEAIAGHRLPDTEDA